MPVSSDLNTHRFTGHERDTETGLDYMMARYYSAGLSRFLSVDPLGASARLENPQSWNRYSYVLNNPVNLTDPDGRDALGDAKKAAAKIASVKAGPAAGAEVKIKAGPVKAQAGASVSASVKVDSGGNVSVQAEKSAGAKVGVGSVEAGLHTSSQTTTVKNGEALGTPEVASQTTVGVSSKGVSAESTGEISVEATIGVAKVGASFNPVAVVEAAVKGAIAVREALHNLATTPSPSGKPKE